jgi:hypothetical protein
VIAVAAALVLALALKQGLGARRETGTPGSLAGLHGETNGPLLAGRAASPPRDAGDMSRGTGRLRIAAPHLPSRTARLRTNQSCEHLSPGTA